MAQFRGYIQGNRGGVSRLGTKKSSLDAKAQGWHLGAQIMMTYNKELNRDEVTIWLTGGSTGACQNQKLGTWFKNKKNNFQKVK